MVDNIIYLFFMCLLGMSPDMCQQKHFNRRKAVYGISSMYELLAPSGFTHLQCRSFGYVMINNKCKEIRLLYKVLNLHFQ